MIPNQVLAALIALYPGSRGELAKELGMSGSNLSAALSGARPFPAERVPRLLAVMGVDAAGALDTTRVHLWKLGRSVGDLRAATSYFFRNGAEFGGVWREGRAPIDFARIADLPLIAISDGRCRVLVRSEVGMFGSPEPVNPETVPALSRRRGRSTRPGGPQMLAVPGAAFSRWERGEISVAEFDRVFDS